MDRLILVLWRRKLLVGLSTLVGAVLGLGLAAMMPERWEAVALVRLGETGNDLIEPQANRLVESPARAIERVRDGAFQLKLKQTQALAADGKPASDEARVVISSLTANAIRGTDLIEVRVSASTPGHAREAAAAVVRELSRVHDQIMLPAIQRLREQLNINDQEIAMATADRRKLFDAATSRAEAGSSARFAENALAGSLVYATEAHLSRLYDRRERLDEALSSVRTFSTSLLSDVYVADQPSAPKTRLWVIAGAILGLFAGLFLVAADRALHS